MSVRQFAAHLGVSGRMVSKWEVGGENVRPRPLNQAALDTSLDTASLDIRSRFDHSTNATNGTAQDVVPQPKRRASSSRTVMPDGAVHFVRHPLDWKLMTLVGPGPFRTGPGRKPVWLPGYYIDVCATTNAEYSRFLAATGHQPPRHWPGGTYSVADDPHPRDDEPVTGLSLDDACAYAFWADKELPSTVQWDRAVRGAEGMLRGDVWEWMMVPSGSARRGSGSALGGEFRCACPVGRVVGLLGV